MDSRRFPGGLGSRPTDRDAIGVSPVSIPNAVEFDDYAGIAYTIAKLREELDALYRRETPKDVPKVRPGKLYDVGVSVISRLQHIDHLQRYQIACLERQLATALNPPKHKFWGAGEKDCPREIKAGNGELHTLRCKVCGVDDPRDGRCLSAQAIEARRAETGNTGSAETARARSEGCAQQRPSPSEWR